MELNPKSGSDATVDLIGDCRVVPQLIGGCRASATRRRRSAVVSPCLPTTDFISSQ
jgi:hypothetical protein